MLGDIYMLEFMFRWSFKDGEISGIVCANDGTEARGKVMEYLLDIFPCDSVYRGGEYNIGVCQICDDNNFTKTRPDVFGWVNISK